MERLLRHLPRAPATAEGGDGRVGVVAGSPEFPGQPSLTGLAALRTGCDDAKALVPAPIYPIVGSHSPNLLVARYEDETFTDRAVGAALELGEWADVLVVGPGLVGTSPAAVQRVVTEVDVPVVVDSSAIEPALDADLADTVFTPDDEETERITERYGSLEAFTETTGAISVHTGDVDVIVDDGERTTNETGTSALTVAGTGDTLAGIVGALISLGMELDDAAELGTWIVGKAGELATTERGNGVLATDVIERIPETIR